MDIVERLRDHQNGGRRGECEEAAAEIERLRAEVARLTELAIDVPALCWRTPSGAMFTCGCCGKSFRSTPDEQRIFDQDAGFGICPPCEMYYR